MPKTFTKAQVQRAIEGAIAAGYPVKAVSIKTDEILLLSEAPEIKQPDREPESWD